ncbi:RimJ/RimL family protein N-acetyltransferase [Paucibacter oligotrophus]|uniref:RimJ/RimL family protein N-acetyltransferase n=1 Tax=Roseateles oligotrophus TaxID=1769250 RepID=A0A840L6Z7_9BURK|nr:GNAT family N-acetyltransferase [Roseateles oligotrophus]MBB4842563.1 RimJ/RimL family protein N-acetyltransferase [Roseateles oligotrophus]
MVVLHTPRLRLEPLTDAHLEGLHRLNSDPEVMRYITGRPDTLADSQLMIERVKARWAEWGYSWWAFIELATGELIGAGCIQHLGRVKTGPLEIGWRLRRERWHQGLASEAAERMADFAFEDLRADSLCAVRMAANQASGKLMERLGMHYTGMEHWYDMDMARHDMSRADWLLTRKRRQSLRP